MTLRQATAGVGSALTGASFIQFRSMYNFKDYFKR
ncbi:hypothetical protein C4K03_0214 [Pseudomonas synxantha]|uniref:Uncharacterized protein n=1 Tax=Pseudomonas synxantha TaxID=47883 RepID=A0A3G7U116_9PSED|nr:hypothetical protein C4K03_0214 [Pseudomonas synxantha]